MKHGEEKQLGEEYQKPCVEIKIFNQFDLFNDSSTITTCVLISSVIPKTPNYSSTLLRIQSPKSISPFINSSKWESGSVHLAATAIATTRPRHRHRHHPPPPPPHHHYYYYPATEPASLPPPPPPPPPPHNYLNPAPCPIPNPSYYQHPAYYAPVNYSVNPLIGSRGYGYGWGQQGWVGGVGGVGVGVGGGGGGVGVVVPNVERESTVKVKSDVNVRKETVRVEVDEENPDCHLVSFDFDASFDGSITIYYFAKKEEDFTFTPIFPEAHMPVKIPFQKGSGQKFKQPSGTGIDLGFFELEDLAKPSPDGDVYPLVIAAEVCSTSSSSKEENSSSTQSDGSPRFQITQTVLEKKNGEPFQVKVMKQVLVIDGVSYELRELYGMGSSTSEDFNEDSGKECVICMTEPKDTAVLPCRHLCMCSECAQALRLQSNRCPICRQPIEKFMEIKVNNTRQ